MEIIRLPLFVAVLCTHCRKVRLSRLLLVTIILMADFLSLLKVKFLVVSVARLFPESNGIKWWIWLFMS